MTNALEAAQAYLEEEKRKLTATARALRIPTAHAGPVVDEAKRRMMVEWAREQHGRDLSAEMAQYGDDYSAWLRLLLTDLEDDVRRALGPRHAQRLDRVAMDFMPHLVSDAFVAGLGDQDEGPWAVGINLGLIWTTNAIVDALMLASRGEDEAAKASYRTAQRVYHAQSHREVHAAWHALPAQSDAQELEAGAIASVVLRFVALHEMGHVALGHVGRMEMGVRPEAGRRHYGLIGTQDPAEVREMEREADLFALQRMIEISQGPDRMWNNLLFISAFFRLLAQVEARNGELLCPYHPPPSERIETLYRVLCQHIGPPPNDAMQWAQQQQDIWGIEG